MERWRASEVPSGAVQHRLQFQVKWAKDQLSKIKSGQLRLSVETATRYPVVINNGHRSDRRHTHHH